MSRNTDAALDLLLEKSFLRPAGELPWGKPSASDLAALLLLLDWHLMREGLAPVSGEVWLRNQDGLPCAPRDDRGFADRLERRLGRLSGADAATSRDLDPATRGVVQIVTRRYARLPSRDALLDAWNKSTPILSSAPTSGAVIDLKWLANQFSPEKPGLLKRAVRKLGL